MSYSQNGSNNYLNGSYERETSNGYGAIAVMKVPAPSVAHDEQEDMAGFSATTSLHQAAIMTRRRSANVRLKHSLMEKTLLKVQKEVGLDTTGGAGVRSRTVQA